MDPSIMQESREQGLEQPSQLLSLPEELIENICWAVVLPSRSSSWSMNGRSLAAVCRTSRTLSRIATKILYRKFYSRGVLLKLANFLRTLWERPDLRGYVQQLSLDFFTWGELTPEHIRAIKATAESLGLGGMLSYGDYGSALHHSDEEDSAAESNDDLSDVDEAVYRRPCLDQNPFEIMAQLIIALSPNLRKLDVEAREVIHEEYEGAFTMLEALANKSPPTFSLPRLHHLTFGHEDGRQVSFEYFNGIFALAPNLRSVIGQPCFDQPMWALDKSINIRNVTDLRLLSGHLSKNGLSTILSFCNRLETFMLCHSTVYGGLEPKCVTPREVVEMLLPHKDSLRHLDLDLSGREERQGEDFYFGLCIEGEEILSLKEFSYLETFRVDGSSILFPLVGSDNYHTNILLNMLPQSIREVRLEDVQQEAAANLLTLTEHLADFPFLAEVMMLGNYTWGPLGNFNVCFKDSDIEQIRQRLKSRGTRFLKHGPRPGRYEEVAVEW